MDARSVCMQRESDGSLYTSIAKDVTQDSFTTSDAGRRNAVQDVNEPRICCFSFGDSVCANLTAAMI